MGLNVVLGCFGMFWGETEQGELTTHDCEFKLWIFGRLVQPRHLIKPSRSRWVQNSLMALIRGLREAYIGRRFSYYICIKKIQNRNFR